MIHFISDLLLSLRIYTPLKTLIAAIGVDAKTEVELKRGNDYLVVGGSWFFQDGNKICTFSQTTWNEIEKQFEVEAGQCK